jgi:hypothetical protein
MMTKPDRKDGPSSPPEPPATYLPFEQRAAEQGVTGWRLPALTASAGWLPGQEVTAEAFAQAVTALDNEVIL